MSASRAVASAWSLTMKLGARRVPSPNLNCRPSDQDKDEDDQRVTPGRRCEHHREDGDSCCRGEHDEVKLAVAYTRITVVRAAQRSRSLGMLAPPTSHP